MVNFHQPGFSPLRQRPRRIFVARPQGECWDNAVAEIFFASIKRELIDRQPWPTITSLRRAVFDWIEGWYNTRRPQLPRLPQPRPVRSSHPPKHQQPRGIINSTNLSVRARQLQGYRPVQELSTSLPVLTPLLDPSLTRAGHTSRQEGTTMTAETERRRSEVVLDTVPKGSPPN